MAAMSQYGYGWVRQNPDWRDKQFDLARLSGIIPPRSCLLTDKEPPIWNQGRIGSCTAHGTLRAYVMDRMKLGEPAWMPSRLFEYFNTRAQMGTTAIDSGGTVRDAFKSIGTWGACDEKLWPYDTDKFALTPTAAAYTEAGKHRAIDYAAIPQDLYTLKQVIAAGFPFVCGITVYSNFESDETFKTGLVDMPRGANLGGHCIAFVGYNSNNYFLFANSWGTNIGDPDFPGHEWLPPDYLLHPDLASDFWVVRSVQA
jgi:C1A family cysteine protease